MRREPLVYVCNQCRGKPCVVVTDYNHVDPSLSVKKPLSQRWIVFLVLVLAALMNEQARLVE